jgi:hypothetical protein
MSFLLSSVSITLNESLCNQNAREKYGEIWSQIKTQREEENLTEKSFPRRQISRVDLQASLPPSPSRTSAAVAVLGLSPVGAAS